MFLEYCENVGFIFEVGSHTFAIESLKHVQSMVMVKNTKMKNFFSWIDPKESVGSTHIFLFCRNVSQFVQ